MGIFDPIWKTEKFEKEDKAIAAVRKISDPQKLKEIALTAPLQHVQEAAIKGISDQKMLCEILLTVDSLVEYVALEGISDQRMLYEILQVLSGRDMVAGLKSAVCKKLTDQSLLRQAALEGFGDADVIVEKISDPKVLVEIASHSHSSSMRCKAVELIKDPDELLSFMSDSLDADVRRTAQDKLDDRFISEFRSDKTLHLTDDQMTRYVDALIAETDEIFEIRWSSFSNLDEDSVRRIMRDARQNSLRAEAFQYLLQNTEHLNLMEAYKEARANYRNQSKVRGDWDEAVNAVEERVVNDESGNAMLLMEFIRDADVGSNMGARCIRRLFDKELDSFDGIETLREEAVETFMKNIPAYGDEDYCLKQLAVSLSPEAQKKYGFEIKAIERENEDQYGRFTERIERIIYKGRQLS